MRPSISSSSTPNKPAKKRKKKGKRRPLGGGKGERGPAADTADLLIIADSSGEKKGGEGEDKT